MILGSETRSARRGVGHPMLADSVLHGQLLWMSSQARTSLGEKADDLLHLQTHLGFKDVESTLATACLHYEAEQEEGATDAFGSAASKLGCNEVEMAERMSDGDIAELVQSLKDVLSRFRSCIAGGNGEIEGDREAIAQAEALLVKAKGQNGANPRIQKSAVGFAEKK